MRAHFKSDLAIISVAYAHFDICHSELWWAVITFYLWIEWAVESVPNHRKNVSNLTLPIDMTLKEFKMGTFDSFATSLSPEVFTLEFWKVIPLQGTLAVAPHWEAEKGKGKEVSPWVEGGVSDTSPPTATAPWSYESCYNRLLISTQEGKTIVHYWNVLFRSLRGSSQCFVE